MKYNIYKIEDINIGDEIYFDNVYSGNILSQANYDEFWTVHGKDKNSLHIKLNYFKKELFWTIDVSEVRQHNKPNKTI